MYSARRVGAVRVAAAAVSALGWRFQSWSELGARA